MCVQKDCVLYRKSNINGCGYCSGLKDLYCKTEECKFYKSKKEYKATDEGYFKRPKVRRSK